MVQSQARPPMTIAKLAAAGGVGVETIRFYQRKGLIETPARNGSVRRYSSDDVRRLRFIRQAQAAGFTLKEIAELIALDAGEDRRRVRQLAQERIRALNAQMSELKRVRDALQRLESQCGESASGPCPILASFEA
jgi:MerR family mercuric resistance operon transcriptional regulator